MSLYGGLWNHSISRFSHGWRSCEKMRFANYSGGPRRAEIADSKMRPSGTADAAGFFHTLWRKLTVDLYNPEEK
jgi:hypothetical protein